MCPKLVQYRSDDDVTTVQNRSVTSPASAASEGAGDPPGVGLLVAVVQRFEALLLLLLAEARGVGHFEEGGSELYEPAGVDGGHLAHVLLGGQDQLVVHHPAENGGNSFSTGAFKGDVSEETEKVCFGTSGLKLRQVSQI